MKNKKLFIILLIIITVIGLYAYFKNFGIYLTHPNANTALVPHLKDLKNIEELKKKNPELAEKKLKELISKLPKKEQHKLNFSLFAGVDNVNFYGKVIDQYGKPVSDAKIRYAIEGQFLSAGSGQGFVMTDQQGIFSFDGKGSSLTLYDVVHPKIDFNPPTSTLSNTYLSDGKNVPIRLKIFGKYTINNPYLLKVWRTDVFENVKKRKEFTYVINSNGNVYTLDFDKKGYDVLNEGRMNGHIRISCERQPILAYHDNQDWRITLESVDGGIQSTDDIYMNFAPETGYEPRIVLEQKKSSPDFMHTLLNQRYYFTAHNGTIYGSLFMHLEPNRSMKKADSTFENECGFSVSYKINLEGTRNLSVMKTQY